MTKITANGLYILEGDSAGTFIQTYGEKVDAGATYEPHVAQTGPLYSCVATGTAIAHVKVG